MRSIFLSCFCLFSGLIPTLLRAEPLTLNVKDFGAIPNDEASDVNAFQAAHDSIPDGVAATIFVPEGDYLFDKPFAILKSHVSLIGEGVHSVIRKVKNKYINLVEIPSLEQSHKVENFPDGVTIKKLTFDGNDVVSGNFAKDGSTADIFVWQAKNLEISDLLLKNNEYMGITISNGYRPSENVTIRNIRGNYFGWCLLHLGNVRNALVEKIFGFESPTQRYGPAAHVGIDIEVEGSRVPEGKYSEGIVESALIRDSIFILPHNTTATGGISITPAYGPINGVAIKNLFFKNYTGQIGAEAYPLWQNGTYSSMVKNVAIDDNWMVSNEENKTHHSPITGTSIEQLQIKNNIINDASGFHRGITIRGGKDVRVENNLIQDKVIDKNYCMVHVEPSTRDSNDIGIALSYKNNAHYLFSEYFDPINDVCRQYVAPQCQDITIQGNTFASTGIDLTPPIISASLSNSETISTKKNVTFDVKDVGENASGIARVMYFIDTIPVGFSSTAPYVLSVDPEQLTNGSHSVGAIAWDNRANITEELVIPIQVEREGGRRSDFFCGLSAVTNTTCAEDEPQLVVSVTGKSEEFFVSSQCNKRLVLKKGLKKSYCNGALKKIAVSQKALAKLKLEKTVADPNRKSVYKMDMSKRVLRKSGKVKAKHAAVSRLSKQEFRMFRVVR